MAYQKKTESILSGSKNVLSPADLLPGTDALLLKNFRANTVGALESRKGSVALLSSSTGWPTSICRVDAVSPRRYFAAGGSLYRNGSIVLAGFGTTAPVGLVSYQNSLFATSDSLQVRDDGTNVYPWQIAGPLVAIAAAAVAPSGAGLTGTYLYFFSWTCADGSESAYGPAVTITLAAQAAALSSFPTYSPPAGLSSPVTGWKIYRGGGSQTSTVSIASGVTATTTYHDEVNDILAQEDGFVIPTVLYEAPPPALGVAPGPFYDRLIMFGSAAHPNRLWWSELLRPYAWPGALLDSGNHIDFGEEGEWILGVTIHATQIVIWKEKSIWRIYGDPGSSTAIAEKVSSSYGLNARNGLLHANQADYFSCTEGIFRFNGETATKVSPKLNPLFLGEIPDVLTANLAVPMETGYAAQMALGYRRGQLYVSYPQQNQVGTILNNWTLVFDVATGNWVDYDQGFSAFCDEGQKGDFVGGAATGTQSLEDGITDAGAIINLDWYGHFSDQGEPEQDKIYNDITFDCNPNGATLTVKAYFDNGNSFYTLGFLTGTARQQFVFPYGADGLGLRGKNHAIRVTGFLAVGSTPTVSPVFLYKAVLHYISQPRYSRTFDSDVTDLGMRDVKFCDFLELDVDISGTGICTWVLSSDRPTATGTNPILASRATSTFTKGTLSGRRTIRFPFTEFEGQLMRLTISGDANTLFLLYSARLRVRPIGVYLDGANGESFRTKEIGIAI